MELWYSTYTVQKVIQISRYNTKCRGNRETTRNIPRSILFSPLPFELYLGKSITFRTAYSRGRGTIEQKRIWFLIWVKKGTTPPFSIILLYFTVNPAPFRTAVKKNCRGITAWKPLVHLLYSSQFFPPPHRKGCLFITFLKSLNCLKKSPITESVSEEKE